VVRVAPGLYSLDQPLVIPRGVQLLGSGTVGGRTTQLQAAGLAPRSPLVQLGGSGASVRDVLVDYAGGEGYAVEAGVPGTSDALVQGARLVGLRHAAGGIGFVAPGHRGLSVQDTQIDGRAADSETPAAGFTCDQGSCAGAGVMDSADDAATGQGAVLRSVVRHVRDYGIAFPTWAGVGLTPWPGIGNVAAGNLVEDVRNPTSSNGTNEAGIWLGGKRNAALRNVVRGLGWEGVWTGTNCLGCQVVGNVVRDAFSAGIYLERTSTGTVVLGNDIARTPIGVISEWTHDGLGTRAVTVVRNRIAQVDRGVVLEDGTDASRVQDNAIDAAHPIVLQRVKGTVVSGNVIAGK
jgi:hypothetical protein